MACRHAYKTLDRAEDLTCESCLFEIKAREYERGLKDATTGSTKRLKCYICGKEVSTPIPEKTVVRAWIECPECTDN